MTLSSLRSRHITNNLLSTSKFAETVLRYAGGERGSITSFTAVVSWDAPAEDDSRGRGTKRTGKLRVAESQAIAVGDRLKIGSSDEVGVTAISPADNGTVDVVFTKYVPETLGAKPVRTGGF